jgi:hypothetical protein
MLEQMCFTHYISCQSRTKFPLTSSYLLLRYLQTERKNQKEPAPCFFLTVFVAFPIGALLDICLAWFIPGSTTLFDFRISILSRMGVHHSLLHASVSSLVPKGQIPRFATFLCVRRCLAMAWHGSFSVLFADCDSCTRRNGDKSCEISSV